MLMVTEKTGNMAMVLKALEGPLGPEPVELCHPITEWCLVLVRSGFEFPAREAMRRRGVGAYWPNYSRIAMVEDTRNGGRIRRTFLTPVVPGVILSPAKFTDLFWNVLDLAPGVINVARKAFGDIIVLNDVDVVLIHKIEQGLNKPVTAKAVHNYKIGDKVRLCDDERSGFGIGKVLQLFKDGRISIGVGGMGRELAITLLPHQIRRP
jgi:hypothetical protein